MQKLLRVLLSAGIVAVVVGLPLAYAATSVSKYRNFRVVSPGNFYRSGKLNETGLNWILNDYGIRSVISLRDAVRLGKENYDFDEAKLCQAKGLNYVMLSPLPWADPAGGRPPVQDNVDAFLKVMDDKANYPVWIHCFAGTHRTGAYCAIYRMEYEHWTNEEAMAELRRLGYVKLDSEGDKDIHDYLANYVPRWKKEAR